MDTKGAVKVTRRADALRVNEEKWSKPLMAPGWMAMPSVIIERQNALGLSPLDLNIILQIGTYWWTPDNKPHPSKKSIATAIGVKPRTVQRRIASMEHHGLIHREERRIKGKGSKTNVYHFDGLIKAALPFAKEKTEDIKRRAIENKKRLSRKRPILSVVS